MSLWKPMFSRHPSSPEEMSIQIFYHVKNHEDNQDKFLVWLTAEQQGILRNHCYNDSDYDLCLMKNDKDMIFVVVGRTEINSLLNLFKN